MTIEFTRAALAQLEAIESYVRARNPAAAARIVGAVEAAMRLLLQFPEIGRRQDEGGVRKIVVRPGRYVIYYRVVYDSDVVRVLAIVHPSRRRLFTDG